MSTLKNLFVVVSLFLAAPGASAEDNLRAKVVGMWDEESPGENLVSFTQEGACKLYLKKGEIGELRSMDGTWTVGDDGKLEITFTVNGETLTQRAMVKFEGEEMVLTDEKGVETRHRRHVGPIPDKYL
ncbi:MAG: hypothetical protein QOH88_2535 [Verrucomicrobiota bacterium]|jgi:uncharacterized protein (TIGR03066 family)